MGIYEEIMQYKINNYYMYEGREVRVKNEQKINFF